MRALVLAALLPLAACGADGLVVTMRHQVDVRLSTDACPPRAGDKAKAEIAALDPATDAALLGWLEQLGDHRETFGCN